MLVIVVNCIQISYDASCTARFDGHPYFVWHSMVVISTIYVKIVFKAGLASFSFLVSASSPSAVCRKSNRKSLLFKRNSATKPKITVKYSAARLQEKGVILEIEGLPANQ